MHAFLIDPLPLFSSDFISIDAGMGESLVRLGNFEEAIPHHTEELKLAKQLELKDRTCFARIHLGI